LTWLEEAELRLTICVYDHAPGLLDDDGGRGDVPAVHADVVVDVGAARGDQAHVHRRRAHRPHAGRHRTDQMWMWVGVRNVPVNI